MDAYIWEFDVFDLSMLFTELIQIGDIESMDYEPIVFMK